MDGANCVGGELGAQPRDAAVYGPGEGVVALAGGEFDELLPAEDPPRHLVEDPHKGNLARRQPLGRSIVAQEPGGPDVDAHRLEHDEGAAFPGPAPQDSRDAGREFAQVHGLHQIVVRAELEPEDAVDRVAVRRHDDDGGAVAAQSPQDVDPRLARKVQVQEDEIGRATVDVPVQLPPGARDDDIVAEPAQILGDRRGEIRFVVDDDDFGHARSPRLPPAIAWRQPMRDIDPAYRFPSVNDSRAQAMPQPTIAVVEDEEHLREAVVEYLSGNGFSVVGAADAAALREMLDRLPVDVAVLDIAMPGEDGLSLARWLSARGTTGIIFATAAGRPLDRVVGLELGADDYLVKPYDLRELLARIRSLLRRLDAAPARRAPEAAPGRVVTFGDMRLDLAARRLDRAGSGRIDLTAMELDLLEALATRPNRVLSRTQLVELAHHREMDAGERAVDIRITRLRGKIEPDPRHPRFIRTVRGEGYVFVIDHS